MDSGWGRLRQAGMRMMDAWRGAWQQAAGGMMKAGKGFWSIDAAFAFVLAVAMFAIFSSLLYAAGGMAARGADDASGSLLSARFSSYALQRLQGGADVDLQQVLARTGRKYASIRQGEDAPLWAGVGGADVYCTQRLIVREGKMVRVEACIG